MHTVLFANFQTSIMLSFPPLLPWIFLTLQR